MLQSSGSSRPVEQLLLPPAEFDRRIALLRKRMIVKGVKCLLVHSPSSIYYFSGFETVSTATYACLIVPEEREPALVLWQLEEAEAERTSWVRNLVKYDTGEDPIRRTCQEAARGLRPSSKIAIELDAIGVTPRAYDAIVEFFGRQHLADAAPIIGEVRRIKSPVEIECYRAAARMTDIGMRAAVDAAGEGARDNDIAAAGAAAMLEAGSEYPCMPPIVSAGSQSGVAHSTFRGIRVAAGDTVVVELGACVRRYSAPLMRTISIRDISQVTQELFAAASDVLHRVLNAARVGASAEDVAKAAWAGMPKNVPDLVFHGVFGYAVGAGFPPSWADGTMRIRLGNPEPIENGMVLHLPIALRRPSRGGVAVSQTIVVGEGGIEVLSRLPSEVFVR